MSFGADFAYALGSVIAPYCEAMVQQRSNAQMATFVQHLRPEEVTRGMEQEDRQMMQQRLYEHGDRLLRDHIQATGAHPQQPVPQQPVPQQPVPQQHVPQQHVPQQHVPQQHVDPPASKGHAKKVARYRTPAGTLEVFIRFQPSDIMDTGGESEVLRGQQGSGPAGDVQPPAGAGSPRSPLRPSPKMSAPPPPPPPPEDPVPPVMESRPKVPSPAAPPKAAAKSRPQPKETEIERMPKLVSVKFVLRGESKRAAEQRHYGSEQKRSRGGQHRYDRYYKSCEPWALGVETKQSRSLHALDADEDMKNMAARTPAKDDQTKATKVEPSTPASKKHRKGESRVKRRLFETPKQETPSPTDRSPGSKGGDSDEDADLWKDDFRRLDTTSLPEKRKALNRPSSRSRVKKRRAGSSPGAPSVKSEIAAAREVPGNSCAEDDDEGRGNELSPTPTPKFEGAKVKPEEAPQAGGRDPATQVESDVLQSLPTSLSERDLSLIVHILTEEDLLTMQDCLENLAEIDPSTLALLCTYGLSFAALILCYLRQHGFHAGGKRSSSVRQAHDQREARIFGLVRKAEGQGLRATALLLCLLPAGSHASGIRAQGRTEGRAVNCNSLS
ncbi:unnamed protein product [Symbiodinium sp. CCMP2592]|nr:unnamed protein product [Symbiodinium sp. CCMP2592]